MKAIQPYLNFDGNTRDAMTFYAACLGGELHVQTFGDVDPNAPAASKDRVMHARITKGSATLMASDTMEGTPFTPGNNVWLNNDCDSVEEIERVFAAFAERGRVLMPLADQFWGARFGMITDQYGVNWMFNCDLAGQPAAS